MANTTTIVPMLERIIAYNPWEKLTDSEKLNIFTLVDKVLGKRRTLYQRYSRGIDFVSNGEIHYENAQTLINTDGTTNDKVHLQIMLEKFIIDIASGYLSGKVEYDVDATDPVQAKVAKLVFDKEPVTANQALELRYIVDTITKNNSDVTELTSLFKDMLLYGSCYERIIDDKKDGYQYYSLDALNTVAIWTDDIKPKLMAVVQAYSDTPTPNGNKRWLYRVYLPKSVEVYSRESKSAETDKDILTRDEKRSSKHEWDDVPVIVYESQFSILDKCESVITAYETLLNNVRNTYKYNAEDCKMKIAGYRPQNPITLPNPDYDPNDPEKKNKPQVILNPARQVEDAAVLAGKTFYVQEGGDADWLIKPVDANDVTIMLKFYIDTIFQLAGIPNTTDLAFNSTDLNASAIDRKFYIMNIVTSNLREGMEQLIRRRFKMFLDRINLKAQTSYDVNNIRITINTNLPSMTDENIDQMLRLDGILSEETILEKLGYDYETEKDRKESELNANMARIGIINPQDENTDDQGNPTNTQGARTTDTDVIRTNRKIQSDSKKNIQDNIQRENAETVQSGTSVGSPIGHQNRGRN